MPGAAIAPSIMLGIGNPVPQGKHHFAMRLEIGGAFRGTPNIGMNFAGSVCTTTIPQVCQNAATDSAFQSDVAAQVKKYNGDISFLQFYPVVSLGFRL